jgi:Zn-dependent M28 family amino/carboxypeptidase
MRIASRPALIRIGLLLALGAGMGAYVCAMPGRSYRGPLPPATAEERRLAAELRGDVEKLAGEIGERHVMRRPAYETAADFIEASFRAAGWPVRREGFDDGEGTSWNLVAGKTGRAAPAEILVVGAHYDTVPGTPGANDNASGVAALLALARHFAGKETGRTLRLVAFANEEPGAFQTELMGSLVHARGCRARKENVVGMLSLETIGYYRDEPNSQKYPFPFDRLYPSTGNFIGFIGNTASRRLVRQTIASFRQHARFPSEGAALPGWIEGVGWSDHWSFWQAGYPALMVTDTAPFRYPHYHRAEDTPDKLDYGRLARVVKGMEAVVAELARSAR